MKSLQTIQKLYQIAKVLSRIAFVCSIVGFCGCILGMITAAFGSSEVLKLGVMFILASLLCSYGAELA